MIGSMMARIGLCVRRLFIEAGANQMQSDGGDDFINDGRDGRMGESDEDKEGDDDAEVEGVVNFPSFSSAIE